MHDHLLFAIKPTIPPTKEKKDISKKNKPKNAKLM